jgi:hypothetical protein
MVSVKHRLDKQVAQISLFCRIYFRFSQSSVAVGLLNDPSIIFLIKLMECEQRYNLRFSNYSLGIDCSDDSGSRNLSAQFVLGC